MSRSDLPPTKESGIEKALKLRADAMQAEADQWMRRVDELEAENERLREALERTDAWLETNFECGSPPWLVAAVERPVMERRAELERLLTWIEGVRDDEFLPERLRNEARAIIESVSTEGGTARQGTAQAVSVGSPESGASPQVEVGAEALERRP